MYAIRRICLHRTTADSLCFPEGRPLTTQRGDGVNTRPKALELLMRRARRRILSAHHRSDRIELPGEEDQYKEQSVS